MFGSIRCHANLVLYYLQKIEDQPMFGITVLQDEFRKDLARTFKEKKNTVEQISGIVQILLSFTFITVFIS